jgi:hypothetical protein
VEELAQPHRRLGRPRGRLEGELDRRIRPQRPVRGRKLLGGGRRILSIPPYGPSPRTGIRPKVKSLNEGNGRATANRRWTGPTASVTFGARQKGCRFRGMGFMATVAAGFEDREVSIGRIFNRAFATIGGNPLVTLGISFLFGALPGTAIGYESQRFRTVIIPGFSIWPTLLVIVAGFALSIVFWTITQGALVRATIAHSEGRRAGFAESIASGLVVALPLFLLGLLSAIGVGFGFILLIMPGVMLYIIWSVAAPALVAERLGVFEAFGRSAYLTDGARWKICGIELIALVAYWMFAGAVGVVQIAIFGGIREMAAAVAQGIPLSYYVLTALSATITTAVWGVIRTSLYIELREWKDGPATDALAEVFG